MHAYLMLTLEGPSRISPKCYENIHHTSIYFSMERDHANDIIVKLELFTHNYELYMCHKLINFSINMYISMVGRRWMLVPIKPNT